MSTATDVSKSAESKTPGSPQQVRRTTIVNFRSLREQPKKLLRLLKKEDKPPDESIISHVRKTESEALGNPREGQTFSERLEELFDDPKEVLMDISTVFPFDLFPDHIRVDPLKIQIIERKFFACEQIHNIPIKDIDDVFVETAPFFATLKIINGRDKEHPIRITRLKKNEAKKAGKVIAGLIIGRSEASDISKVEAIR